MATGISLGLLAALCAAVAHLLGKICLGSMSLTYFLKIRTLGAAVATLLAGLAFGHYSELRRLEPEQFAMIAAGGILSPWLISTLVFWGMERMPLNVNAPIFRSSPVFALVFSILLLNEKLTGATVAGVLIVVLGVTLFSWRRARAQAPTQHVAALPIIAVLVGALFYGLTVVLWKIFGEWASGTTINLIQCAVASVIWAGVDACARGRCPRQPALIGRAALSGILIFGAANILSIMALKHIVAPAVTALSATSTLMIGVMAQVYLRERWDASDWAFAVIIVAGVAVMGAG